MENGLERVFATLDALIDFIIYGRLAIQEHHERAESLDVAEAEAIAAIARSRSIEDRNGFAGPSKYVPLLNAIGIEFACGAQPEPYMAWPPPNCGFGAKSIVWISREDDNWRFVLRNHWDQEVILNSKYDLVRTRRLPKPFDATP